MRRVAGTAAAAAAAAHAAATTTCAARGSRASRAAARKEPSGHCLPCAQLQPAPRAARADAQPRSAPRRKRRNATAAAAAAAAAAVAAAVATASHRGKGTAERTPSALGGRRVLGRRGRGCSLTPAGGGGALDQRVRVPTDGLCVGLAAGAHQLVEDVSRELA